MNSIQALSQKDDPRVARALEEYLAALEAGKAPDRREFLGRYGDIAVELGRCLDGLEFIQAAAEQNPIAPEEAAASPFASEMEADTRSPLGDFRIVREVGRGGMGVVYEAVQISLGRRVALKVLPFAAALDPKQLQRFKNEAQAAAQLHHTNIVPVFGVGCERGVHYYAMQFIEGQTLAAVIRDLRQTEKPDIPAASPSLRLARSRGGDVTPDGPSQVAPRSAEFCASTGARDEAPADAPPMAPATQPVVALTTERSTKRPAFFRTVAHLGVQAAEALEHAHQLGVVHRDIKPANLLVDVRGNLWVTDFGLAQCQGQPGLTLTGDFVGTFRYMSPEQASARRGLVDHRTDIYSLGVTLYELVTLQPACTGHDRAEVLLQIASEEPPAPRRLNRAIAADLQTIVLKAIAKSPEDRYAAAQELADDLRRFLEDKPIHAKPPTLVQRARKWSRRHKAVVVAGLLLVGVAVVALAVGTFLLWREQRQTALQKTRAETALAAEAAERERADANVRLALQALEQIYLQVAEERLPRAARISPEDRQLLQKALTFYKSFAENNSPYPDVQRDAGKAYRRVGEIHSHLGEHAPAVEAFSRAIAVFDPLTKEFADKPEYRFELAASLNHRGHALPSLNRLEEAEQSVRQAQALLEPLAANFPNEAAYLEELADSHFLLSSVHSQRNRAKEAEESIGHALELQQRLVALFPEVARYEFLLADSFHNLGLLLERGRRLRDAESAYRQALALKEKLRDANPKSPLYRDSLANSQNSLSNVLGETGRPQEAEAGFQRNATIYTQLVEEYPQLPNYRRGLADSLANLALVLANTGRTSDAEKAYRQALPIREKLAADFRDNPTYRHDLAYHHVMLAEMLVGLGRFAEAEQSYRQASDLLEELVAHWPAATGQTKSLALCLTNHGLVLRNMNRHAEAEQVLRRALDLHAKLVAEYPRDTSAHSALAVTRDNLAVLLAATGRLDDAEQLLQESVAAQEKLIVDFPDVPDFQSRLGTSLHNLAEFLDHRRGRLAEAHQRMEQAVLHQQEALRQHSKHVRYLEALKDHYGGLADILVRLGDYAGAAVAAADMSRFVPDDWQACHRAAGYVARCVKVAESDANLPADERARLATIYADQARALLQQALQKGAGKPDAQNDLAWFLANHADARFRDPAQAVELAKKAVAQEPQKAGYWNTLGVAQYRTGDRQAAIQAVEKSMALSKGGNSADWFMLAMAHWQQGEKEQARKWYDQAVGWMDKNKPTDEELRRFRAEAAALLGLQDSPGPPRKEELPEKK